MKTSTMRFCARSGLVLLLVAISGFGQSTSQTGVPDVGVSPFATYDGPAFGTTSLSSGAFAIEQPLLSFSQRRGFTLGDMTLIYSAPGYIRTTQCNGTDPDDGDYHPDPRVTCYSYWDQARQQDSAAAAIDLVIDAGPTLVRGYAYDSVGQVAATYYSVLDGLNKEHTMMPTSAGWRTTDGSGWMLSNDLNTLLDQDGTAFSLTVLHSTNLYAFWTTATNSHGVTIQNTYQSSGIVSDSLGRLYTSTPTNDFSGCVGPQPINNAKLIVISSPAGGTPVTLKACYTQLEVRTGFNTSTDGTGDNEFHQVMSFLETLVLPDKRTWIFGVDVPNASDASSISYGVLTDVTLPTGGKIHVSYPPTYYTGPASASNIGTSSNGLYSIISQAVPVTSVTRDALDSKGSISTKYFFDTDPDPQHYKWLATIKRYDENAVLVESETHRIDTKQNDRQTKWLDGSGNVLRTVDSTYSTNDILLDTYYRYNGDAFDYTPAASYLTDSTTTLADGTTCTTGESYDPSFAYSISFGQTGNPNVVTDWGSLPFGIKTSSTVYGCSDFQSGVLLRTDTVTPSFVNNPNYLAKNMLGLVDSKSVYGQNGIEQTTSYFYDSQNQAFGTGDLNSIRQADLTGINGDSTDRYSFDSLGQMSKHTDARGSDTTFTYDPQNFYLTGTSRTVGSITLLRRVDPDVNVGVPNSMTDENNQITTYTYYPDFRLKEINHPDGGDTQYTYTQTATTSRTLLHAATWQTTVMNVDGFGRTTATRSDDGIGGQNETDTVYDALGRVASVSNPHTVGSTSINTTGYLYDALNRKTEEIPPNSVGHKRWTFVGMNTTFADETGKSTTRSVDNRGLLHQVIEDPQNLALVTTYEYDGRGNLTKVTQGGSHVRQFTYDSLSRLITSLNPETGLVCYGLVTNGSCVNGYDPNGNLRNKTDARNIITQYAYDSLNRLLSKSYISDTSNTPFTCYLYDASQLAASSANLLGRVAHEWTQRSPCPTATPAVLPGSGIISRTSYLSYDQVGRVLQSQQCVLANCATGATPFPLTRAYDSAGSLSMWSDGINQAYFTQQTDQAGHIAWVHSSWVDAVHPEVLFSGTSNVAAPMYTPFGSLQSWNLGEHLHLTRSYDSRLRVTSEIVIPQ